LNKSFSNRKTRYLLSILFIFSSTTQISCQPKRASNEIIIASAGKISSLDPAQANTFQALQVIGTMGDTLYKINEKGEIEPQLAKSLPILGEDGLSLKIDLREDIFFHDGTKFNAEAMAFTIERFLRIGTLNYIIDGRIKSIETPNEFTIILNLTRQSSSLVGFLTSVNLTPVSPLKYKEYKNDFLNQDFIGTGPYKLKTFKSRKQKLVRFDKYHGEKPYINRINFINLTNSTALYGAMLSKEVDVLISNSIDEDQVRSLNKLSINKKINEGTGDPIELGYIVLRANDTPFSRTKVREALSLSVDRKLLNTRVSYNLRNPSNSIIPSKLRNIDDKFWPKYDPKKARELLKEEGFCDQRKLNFVLTFRSNVPSDKILALTWRSQIKNALSDCISFRLNGLESTSIYKQLSEGIFDAVILDWRGAYMDPEAYLSPLLSCEESEDNICFKGESVIGGSFWNNSKIQIKLKESESIYGENRLLKLREVEELAAKDIPLIPLWFVRPRAWSQKNISKPEFDERGQLLVNKIKIISDNNE
tara:strand:+ start:9179 stop:10780 length:1602 start_codon:yes stop_codon:yes gene_type:complete